MQLRKNNSTGGRRTRCRSKGKEGKRENDRSRGGKGRKEVGCELCVAHAQHELLGRARTKNDGTTETAATVRHEREQGDEKGERENEVSFAVRERKREKRNREENGTMLDS